MKYFTLDKSWRKLLRNISNQENTSEEKVEQENISGLVDVMRKILGGED